MPVIEDRASSEVDKKEGIQVSERVDTTMTLCIIARKSMVHPGTRFIARGLNKDGGAGNEVEVEQIVWTGDQSVRWNTCVWQRGIVPLTLTLIDREVMCP